jgi:hypothetical protein
MITENEIVNIKKKIWPGSPLYIIEDSSVILLQDADRSLIYSRYCRITKKFELEQMFSRQAVLQYLLSLESFINFVYQYYFRELLDLQKRTLKNKMLNASILCLPRTGGITKNGEVIYQVGDSIETFDENSYPFESFIELKKIRDDIVHSKPINKEYDIEEYSLTEAPKDFYPKTGIPKEIIFWRYEHAKTVSVIHRDMYKSLNHFFKGDLARLFSVQQVVEYVVKGNRRKATQEERSRAIENYNKLMEF